MNDEQLIRELGYFPGTTRADLAITVRDAMAEMADVNPESITPSMTFEWYSEQLRRYDSIDFLDFVFQLERRLDVRVPRQKDLARQSDFVDGELCRFIRGIVELNIEDAAC